MVPAMESINQYLNWVSNPTSASIIAWSSGVGVRSKSTMTDILPFSSRYWCRLFSAAIQIASCIRSPSKSIVVLSHQFSTGSRPWFSELGESPSGVAAANAGASMRIAIDSGTSPWRELVWLMFTLCGRRLDDFNQAVSGSTWRAFKPSIFFRIRFRLTPGGGLFRSIGTEPMRMPSSRVRR